MHPAAKTPGRGRPGEATHRSANGRSVEARLDEAVSLARTIDLEVVDAEIARIAAPRPSSLFGSGTLDNLAALVEAH
ncbi:MAG TPA: GTPase HflX, partial [Stellaceae bacterium]|nr:GTPase HflX [Stellaceae bacterium]